MNNQLQKDQSVIRLLDGLRARLGSEAFDVIDHWEADLCAIGIARPDNHGVLVYFSTYGESGERYFVSLELPPQPGSDIPYTAAGELRALTSWPRLFGDILIMSMPPNHPLSEPGHHAPVAIHAPCGPGR